MVIGLIWKSMQAKLLHQRFFERKDEEPYPDVVFSFSKQKCIIQKLACYNLLASMCYQMSEGIWWFYIRAVCKKQFTKFLVTSLLFLRNPSINIYNLMVDKFDQPTYVYESCVKLIFIDTAWSKFIFQCSNGFRDFSDDRCSVLLVQRFMLLY